METIAQNIIFRAFYCVWNVLTHIIHEKVECVLYTPTSMFSVDFNYVAFRKNFYILKWNTFE